LTERLRRSPGDLEQRLTRDQLLMPGGDYIVELARGGADNALGVCKTAREKPTLNLDAAFADGADPDLFNAALLHELAHSFTYKNGFPEGYPFSAGALASAAAGPERGKEGFFAEYYQYGRRLTYGGGR
jgi:hypothetical protein